MERELIAKFQTNNKDHGYNITSGGETIGKHSQESRRKMSLSKIGKPSSRKGMHHSDEAKKNMPMLTYWRSSESMGKHKRGIKVLLQDVHQGRFEGEI